MQTSGYRPILDAMQTFSSDDSSNQSCRNECSSGGVCSRAGACKHSGGIEDIEDVLTHVPSDDVKSVELRAEVGMSTSVCARVSA